MITLTMAFWNLGLAIKQNWYVCRIFCRLLSHPLSHLLSRLLSYLLCRLLSRLLSHFLSSVTSFVIPSVLSSVTFSVFCYIFCHTFCLVFCHVFCFLSRLLFSVMSSLCLSSSYDFEIARIELHAIFYCRVMVFGSVFNGVAASITMAAPSLLSVIWFPLNERTTATALGAASGYVGTGVAFVAGRSLYSLPLHTNHSRD